MKNYKTEYLTGISYRQRLELLQKHYLGAYKARLKAKALKPKPGSEAERVHFTGRA